MKFEREFEIEREFEFSGPIQMKIEREFEIEREENKYSHTI